LKIFLGAFVLSFFFLSFSFGETDTSRNTPKQLDQLRKEYLADKATLDQINKTKEKIREKTRIRKYRTAGRNGKKLLRIGSRCGKKRSQVIPNI
jgi:hypothetical protein